MNSHELAKLLGISVTALRKRAENLGLTPEEVRQGRGRPIHIWSNEQCEALIAYGTTASSDDTEQWTEAIEVDGQSAIVSAQRSTLAAIGNTLSAFDQQCSLLEEQTAAAIAARAAAIPSRSFERAAAILSSQPIGVDLARFAVPVSPYARQIAGDRFPETID